MLELRPTCEHCNVPLPPDSRDARICSFECTFCAACVESLLGNVCPNCGGGFARRPIRPAENLVRHPASLVVVHRPVDLAAHGKLVESSYEKTVVSRHGDYTLTGDPARVDLDVVCELLRDTYWAADRSREQIARSIRNSLCFSVHLVGRQVGVARVLTDHGASSYVLDVVIHPEHRGRGIGRWLVGCVLRHPEVSATRALLTTRDAQALYRELGFVTHPFECMVRSESSAARSPAAIAP